MPIVGASPAQRGGSRRCCAIAIGTNDTKISGQAPIGGNDATRPPPPRTAIPRPAANRRCSDRAGAPAREADRVSATGGEVRVMNDLESQIHYVSESARRQGEGGIREPARPR